MFITDPMTDIMMATMNKLALEAVNQDASAKMMHCQCNLMNGN